MMSDPVEAFGAAMEAAGLSRPVTIARRGSGEKPASLQEADARISELTARLRQAQPRDRGTAE